ncbi:DUF805 domain-containing protein [Kocuria indica]|uniref:DUF805 domain-containing protein n=1 Tax=Kocuria marina subsp. indica TaxID=1049583 RepID=A0A6N9QXY6_9MICC|nr:MULTISPECIES: DUF805 domain-containing protein [Kocuria]MCT1616991.1 DUF805 domain-containing protein [Kocuria marina]NDO78102.1 DUF805 domain-containing protein [Kocuria indica]
MTYPAQPLPRSTQPGEPVGPLGAVRNYVRKGFRFSGRASRSEYWWVALWTVVISLLMELGNFRLPDEPGGSSALGLILALLLFALSIFVVIFSLSLSVRRLHDINASGLWVLVIFIPLLGHLALLVMAAFPPNPRGARFDNQTLPTVDHTSSHE